MRVEDRERGAHGPAVAQGVALGAVLGHRVGDLLAAGVLIEPLEIDGPVVRAVQNHGLAGVLPVGEQVDRHGLGADAVLVVGIGDVY